MTWLRLTSVEKGPVRYVPYWSDHSLPHLLTLYSRAVSRACLQCHISRCQRIDTALLPGTLHPSKRSLLVEISPSAFGHAFSDRCGRSRKSSGPLPEQLSRAALTPSKCWAIMFDHWRFAPFRVAAHMITAMSFRHGQLRFSFGGSSNANLILREAKVVPRWLCTPRVQCRDLTGRSPCSQ